MNFQAWWRNVSAGYLIRRNARRWSRKLRLRIPEPTVKLVENFADDDFEVARAQGGYIARLNGRQLDFMIRYRRLSPALYWIAQCPLEIDAIRINLSDGYKASAAPFAFSVNSSDVQPLPDSEFFSSRGFAALRDFAASKDVEWGRRSDRLRWRGSANGIGKTDYVTPCAQYDPVVLPRIRMALILKDFDRTDAALYRANDADTTARLQRDGLIGAKIPKTDWIEDKLALDIDGFTNAWSNFLIRLHLGCCVIKVDSQHGYRQWYYDRIRPWEHFVPVRADMTDLTEKIHWARTHDDEARQIANNGQAFARSMTFESETDWAVAAICATRGVSRN